MKSTLYFLLFTFCLTNTLVAQKRLQKKLQNKFISVEDGDTIFIEEGNYQLDASLWLDSKKNVVIQGAGQDKTILSFKGQSSGAEGLKVTASENIVIRDLTVRDAKGDNIKIQNTDGIHFYKVTADWSGKPKSTNGAYAFYPVSCSNVLIEHCKARGASDAGVYVGQSKHIIVRNCLAVENVAGIEIENSLYAEVYDNEAYNNTGGILVFDLPDLMQKKGGFVRVYNNNVHDNNYKNFAPKGNIVAVVPQGTGVCILATNDVEVFNNKIINNRSAGIAVMSYYITEKPIKDKDYYPYPKNVHIHDNELKRKRVRATARGRIGLMFRFKLRMGRNVPHILYDGILDEKVGDIRAHNICIHDNTEESIINFDAANGFKNRNNDLAPFKCSLDPLTPQLSKLK